MYRTKDRHSARFNVKNQNDLASATSYIEMVFDRLSDGEDFAKGAIEEGVLEVNIDINHKVVEG